MIKRELFYYVICDGCGEFFPGSEGYLLETEKIKIIHALEGGGWIRKGQETFCEECQEEEKKEK